jgi:uncharacterized DUF497 family protein
LRDRGIGFDDGTQIFAGAVVIWQNTGREYGEGRFRAVGESQGDVLHVVFTRRSAAVRIISVRRANRKKIEVWRIRE